MNKITYRQGQFLLFILSLFVLLGSFYFQYVEDLTPCPLCIMQRLCTFFLTLLCFLCWLWVKPKTRFLTILQSFFSLLGIYFAARQLWLMSLPPDETGTCIPGLNMMLHYFPWQDILRALFLGSVDCSENQWTWLGISMPAWSLMYFSLILIGTYFLRPLHWKKNPK